MITLQTQPSPVTCVQTCLAMALGIPVEQVIEHYGAEPMNPKKLLHALTECGIEWSQQTLPTLMFSGFYFAVVPSLNHRGGFHQIILEYDAARGCNGMKIYDPAIGNRYKEDGSDILSWAELIGFWPGGKLPNAARGYPLKNTEELAGFLIKHGIIDPCALEDSEGFDNGRTMARLAQAIESLNHE